jgi:hypothetical protein
MAMRSSLTIRAVRFYSPIFVVRGTSSRMNRRQFGRIAAAAAASRYTPALAQRVDKYAEQLTNGEFNWYPDRSETGPIIAIVSLPDQRVYVYRNGVRIAASSCSTGKLGHRTPTGVFKILQKDKNHHSSTYNNAPMPYMNRLTWSGIALHAGQLPGYPASHGCVRLPKDFAELLFGVTKLGMTVVIADEKSQPEEVTHPGMVLGEYAAREFNAVDTAIKATEYSKGAIPRRNHRASSSAAPTNQSGCSTMAPWRLPVRSRFRTQRSHSASVCSPSMGRTISPVFCHGKPRRSERRRRQPKTMAQLCAASRPTCQPARPSASGSNSA